MQIGLVLGAGGVIGLAYHAAALAAIEQDLGWDPRSADVVVGTSAGSVVGALLRRGVPASDLAAVTVGAEPRSVPPEIIEALQERPSFPPVRLGSFLAAPRLPSLGLVAAWARRPWRLDPVAALASVLPDGSLDLAEHATMIQQVFGGEWPDQDLWLCTVCQDDLRRVVVGLEHAAPLATAVCASCAVPSYFRPVDMGGRPHIDGGVRSPTNADVLLQRPLDLAIIVSPMSGRDLGLLSPGDLVRRRARRLVEGERERLHRAGVPSVLIEPSHEVVEVLGMDFMSDANLVDIVRAAFIDTGDQIREALSTTPLGRLYTQGRRRRRAAVRATVRRSGPAHGPTGMAAS